MTQEVGCQKVTPCAGWFPMCPQPLNRGGQSLRSHSFGERCPSSCLLFSFPPLLLSFPPVSLPLSLFTSFLSLLLSLSPLPLSIPVLVPLSHSFSSSSPALGSLSSPGFLSPTVSQVDPMAKKLKYFSYPPFSSPPQETSSDCLLFRKLNSLWADHPVYSPPYAPFSLRTSLGDLEPSPPGDHKIPLSWPRTPSQSHSQRRGHLLLLNVFILSLMSKYPSLGPYNRNTDFGCPSLYPPKKRAAFAIRGIRRLSSARNA